MTCTNVLGRKSQILHMAHTVSMVWPLLSFSTSSYIIPNPYSCAQAHPLSLLLWPYFIASYHRSFALTLLVVWHIFPTLTPFSLFTPTCPSNISSSATFHRKDFDEPRFPTPPPHPPSLDRLFYHIL